MPFGVFIGSGTESDSDESVPELEEQDSTQTQQAQVSSLGDVFTVDLNPK